jgi:pimeloyl-ACP methyl ester carboxylesterase
VLGIAGENDPERANLEKMMGLVPDCTMHVLPGRGHMDAVADPQFIGIIMEYLSGRK